MTSIFAGPALVRRRIALGLVVWTAVAALGFWLNAPLFLRLPINGLYSLFAVGVAVVLLLRIEPIPMAISLTIAVGFTSLILASQLTLYTDIGFSAAWTMAAQAAVVVVLSAIVWFTAKSSRDR